MSRREDRKDREPTEGDVVTPDGDRRSAGLSRENLPHPITPTRRDPRPGAGERDREEHLRPEDMETHEEAQARRAAGGAPLEGETQPTGNEPELDPGSRRRP